MENKDHNWDSSLKNIAAPLRAIDNFAKRAHKEPAHDYRGNYQRDRDRILYTATFRRLIGKTQIFNTGMGEHYRNRLTHTLEVVQIATTISKCLGLNMELTEAIALGHDIGHAPFGHIGERTLNYIMNNCDILDKYGVELKKGQRGFKHNLQGLRILCNIESYSRKYSGMNITFDTLWGIVNHTSTEWDKCDKLDTKKSCCLMKRDRQKFKCPNLINKAAFQNLDYYDQYLNQILPDSWSFEAYVVEFADEIAQRHHDIEDGIISEIFEPMGFIDKFKEVFQGMSCYNTPWVQEKIKEIETEAKAETEFLLPLLSNFIINFYVTNYIIDTAGKLKDNIIDRYSIKNSDDFYQNKKTLWDTNNTQEIMSFDEGFKKPDEELKDYLKKRIINSRKAQLMDGKGTFIIRNLFEAYLSTPNQLPDSVILKLFTDYGLIKNDYGKIDRNEIISKYDIGGLREELENRRSTQEEELLFHLCRNICDYISSMTDRYALRQYEKLYESTFLI